MSVGGRGRASWARNAVAASLTGAAYAALAAWPALLGDPHDWVHDLLRAALAPLVAVAAGYALRRRVPDFRAWCTAVCALVLGAWLAGLTAFQITAAFRARAAQRPSVTVAAVVTGCRTSPGSADPPHSPEPLLRLPLDGTRPHVEPAARRGRGASGRVPSAAARRAGDRRTALGVRTGPRPGPQCPVDLAADGLAADRGHPRDPERRPDGRRDGPGRDGASRELSVEWPATTFTTPAVPGVSR
ncbi:hypothetical protein [Streptomyces noursei]|uniref:hypothetical protein n=1 Tax=Streptomyces noursei TaxID=1971 RepID=UPI0003A47E5C|nr:hypothetical protein [Streptomyces noursei]UWS76452.1 hypothetical protein N1H47_37540 [Streptomyces noursei]